MIQIKTAKGEETKNIVTREEWLTARKNLLIAEKELTRKSDELAKKRQELPWVRVDKEYWFDTGEGKLSLKDLFKGRSQLIVYHFMFGPDYAAGCPSCSSIAEEFDGVAAHLKNHDVMLWAISRGQLSKLQTYQKRMGWHFPWASSFESDFNFDYGVSFTEQQQQEGIHYNYREEKPMLAANNSKAATATPDGPTFVAGMTGTDLNTYTRERPGMSAFAMENGVIYHTYSAYTRGLDVLWNVYQWLDRAPKGRNENNYWIRRHDEYSETNDNATKCCCS